MEIGAQTLRNMREIILKQQIVGRSVAKSEYLSICPD